MVYFLQTGLLLSEWTRNLGWFRPIWAILLRIYAIFGVLFKGLNSAVVYKFRQPSLCFDNMCVFVFGPTIPINFFVCAHVFLGVLVWTFVFWCVERMLLAAVSAVAWWYILQAPSSPCWWYFTRLLVLSPCCWYYPTVVGTIPLYHSPGDCTELYRACTSTFIPLYHPPGGGAAKGVCTIICLPQTS